MKLGLLLASWFARNAVALVLIVLVLLVGRHLLPPSAVWFGAQTESLRTLPRQQAAYAAASRAYDRYAESRRAEAERSYTLLAGRSDAQLRVRRETLGARIAAEERARLSAAQLALAAARGDADALFRHHRAGAEAALLGHERRLIDALLSARAFERDSARLAAQRRLAEGELRTSHAAWIAARSRIERLERRFLAGPRDAVCRVNPLPAGCGDYRALLAARREAEAALARNKAAHARIAVIDAAQRTLVRAGAVSSDAGELLNRGRAALSSELTRLDEAARRSPALAGWRMVAEVLPTALLILLLAILSPVLVKAVLYFGVAPLGARRPPIRLLPDEAGAVDLLAPSAVSQRVELSPDEVLLVLPQALRSTPHTAAKRTRWLLDAGMPLSSLASGLFALTEVRTDRPDTVLVSAMGGPLAAVGLVRVHRGSALVLRPRALRGLVRPVGASVRIERRWRLGVSAWLTLQFRYLVFHGPCTLILEGARGVRLERAGSGRGSDQAATLGFSARLAYSVARSETFGAYLLGRQALFKDSFASGDGVHLQEEAPMQTGQGGPWGRGLRGLGDAALRVVGL